MNKKQSEITRKWLVVLMVFCALLVFLCAATWFNFMRFNEKKMSVTGTQEEADLILMLDNGSEKQERWEAQFATVDSPDTPLHFYGETVSGAMYNNKKNAIKNWKIKISPKNECYLNGFWGIEIEIHQFREGKEIVETLNSIVNNSEIKKLEVNPYLDNMMIRFLPGDYFVLSARDKVEEDVIDSEKYVGVVFNFYYDEPLDFSNYVIEYRNDIKISETWVYPVLIISWIIWICALVSFISVLSAKRRVTRELKNSVQAVSVMADLYLYAYIINPEEKTAYPIKGDDGNEIFNFESKHIQDRLYSFAEEDSKSIYTDALKEFLTLSTLDERMQNASNLVFEYVSRKIGWCAIRIFKLEPAKSSVQYILAIQVLNEEKKKLYAIEESIRQKESAVTTQGNFIDNTFFAMDSLFAEIRQTSDRLAKELPDDEYKKMLQSLSDRIEHVYLLKNCVSDLFKVDSDHFELRNESYSINAMVSRLQGILRPFYTGKNFEFQVAVDPAIPDRLYGDKERLMQILVVLLFSSMYITEKGFVRLSVKGKQKENTVELLFSVKDSAVGFSKEQLEEVQEALKYTELKPLENVSAVYMQIMNQILRRMNSELKLISVLDSGSEFYFTVEQKVE